MHKYIHDIDNLPTDSVIEHGIGMGEIVGELAQERDTALRIIANQEGCEPQDVLDMIRLSKLVIEKAIELGRPVTMKSLAEVLDSEDGL